MKVAAKLIILLALAMTAVTVLSSYFSSKQFVASIEKRHDLVAQVLLVHAAEPEFRKAMEKADHRFFQSKAGPIAGDMNIRWVWLDENASPNTLPAASEATSPQSNVKQRLSFRRNVGDGMNALHTYYPVIESGGQRLGAIEITSLLAKVDLQGRQIWFNALLTIGALALLSIGMMMTAGVRWIARPLDALNQKMQRVGEGDFASDLEPHSRDELGELAVAVNQMCDRLRQQQAEIEYETNQKIHALEQLRHADRLKTIGELAAGVAHEVGTPLNVVSGRASLLLEQPEMSPEEVRRNARAIKSESERISTIVNKLLHFARRQPSQKTTGDLRTVVQHVVDLLSPLAEKRNIRLETALPQSPANAQFDFSQLQQVLMNLVDNAIDASPQGKQVLISLEPGQQDHFWKLSVADQGTGVPRAHQAKIFEPFFTTKETGDGTGLGLSIAHGIVEEHGGTLDIDSIEGQGTCFIVEIPESHIETSKTSNSTSDNPSTPAEPPVSSAPDSSC